MSWQTVKLGEVISHRKGSITISNDQEYKLCRVQLHRKGVLLRGITKGAEIRTKKQQLCKGNDFIVAEMDAKFGGYGFIPEDLNGAIVSSHYYLFEVNEELLKRDFLLVLIKNLILQNQIKAIGSTNYSRVSPKDVLAWEIPLPSIQEQEIIIKEIEIVERNKNQITTELSQQLELARQLRQAFLHEAMQGELVPQNGQDESAEILLEQIKAEKEKLIVEKRIRKEKPLPEIKPEELPFEIPSSWAWCRFQEITTVITCGMASTPRYYESGRMFLSAKNVKPFRFMPDNHKFVDEETYRKIIQNAKPEINDILITRVGAGIGETALIDTDIDFAYYVSLTLVKPIKNHINSMFLVFWLNSPKGIQSAISYTTGTGSSQGNLNVEKVRGFYIPLPPIAEQKRIVEKLEKLMEFCDELEANIRESVGNADSLLQVTLKESLAA